MTETKPTCGVLGTIDQVTFSPSYEVQVLNELRKINNNLEIMWRTFQTLKENENDD